MTTKMVPKIASSLVQRWLVLWKKEVFVVFLVPVSCGHYYDSRSLHMVYVVSVSAGLRFSQFIPADIFASSQPFRRHGVKKRVSPLVVVIRIDRDL